jgi:glyoxylase-like metal-dependent hydrolase (beta-lactamase superfamily II)
MIFRQLFDRDTCTYTYLVADQDRREAVLIDPIISQIDRDAALIEELHLTLKYALDTHVHADHTTASGKLREQTGCQTGIAATNNVTCADHSLKCGEVLALGKLQIEVLCTPGHTDGCLSYLIDNHLFSGDSLLIRGCGRTDFQNGDAGTLYDSIFQKLFTLPEDTLLHPGHDYHGRTVSTIGEEKQYNPRLTLGRDDFIEFMSELNLANPKYMMEAIPANQSCGNI